MSSRTNSALIILPVLAGVAYAGYLLYQESQPSSLSNNLEKNHRTIGELIVSENNVKRQLGGDVMWDEIKKSSAVYSKDSVRTGKDSQAVVKFTDGSLLEISENSLVVLDQNSDNLNINFKAGDISSKSTSSRVQIAMKDAVVAATGAELKLKTGAETKTEFKVAKGRAAVTDRTKKTTEVAEQEMASVDNGVAHVSHLDVSLKTPADNNSIQTNLDTLGQPFTWQVSNSNIKDETFEISKSQSFDNAQTKTLKAHQAVTTALIPGAYFWRVSWQAPNKGLMHTEVRKFTVEKDQKLSLVVPENGSHFDIDDGDSSVELQWNSRVPAKVYVVEVASNPNFTKMVYTSTLKETKSTAKSLSAQSYFWRVRAYGEKNQELAQSTIGTFSVKLKVAKLPDLVKPVADAVWTDADAIEFSWRKMPEAKEYRLTVSTDGEQKEIVKAKTVDILGFHWTWTTPGNYFWSVKAIGAKNGTVIGQSEIRKLSIQAKDLSPTFEIINPKDQSEVNREKAESIEPILFQWKVLKKLSGPLSLIVSHDAEFTEAIKQDNITKTSASVRIQTPGIYYWKLVSGADVSSVSTFTLKTVKEMEAPEPIEPGDKDKVEIDGPTAIKFQWKKIDDAATYHVVVQKVDSRTGEKVNVIDRTVPETELTSQPLKEGDYSWTVSALDDDGKEGAASHVATFSLTAEQEMDAPKLNAPVVK